MNERRSSCLVLAPDKRLIDERGRMIDFGAVSSQIIRPAIENAGLCATFDQRPWFQGVYGDRRFEEAVLSELAIVDLSVPNVDALYQLGIRHGLRPDKTIVVMAEKSPLNAGTSASDVYVYGLTADGRPISPKRDRQQLEERLIIANSIVTRPGHPLFDLLIGYGSTDVARLKTDVFRDRVRYAKDRKVQLAEARSAGVEALRSVEAELDRIKDENAGVVIDLFLSYRAVMAWDEMIALADKMAEPLRYSPLVQEQCAFALNRVGRSEHAEEVLLRLIEQHGPSSETNGLLGRVYKDRWSKAVEEGKKILAKGLLHKAIAAYLAGFDVDWRDAYPGINAVTLMEMCEPPDGRQPELIPVVSYAAKRRTRSGHPDYWDYATLLELAVLGNDREQAIEVLAQSLANVREVWEPKTTARNLRLIRDKRAARGADVGWVDGLLVELEASI